jgi:hypothetical protein
MKRGITILAAGLFFAACSGSSGGGGGGSGGSGGSGACNASVGVCSGKCTGCTLLTSAQISKAFGLPVGAGKNQNGNCEWDSTTGDGLNTYDLVLDAGGNYLGFQNECRSSASTDVTQVSGIGDGACVLANGGELARPILTFLRGCTSYTLNVGTAGTFQGKLSDAQIEAAEKELALEVLANL